MTSDSIIAGLQANGYMVAIENDEHGEHVHVGGSRADFLYLDSSDYAKDNRQYLRDAAVNVAVLAFEVGDASPLATKFMAEVLRLVAPADKLLRKPHVRPLVRTTPTTLHAIYQADRAGVALYIDELPYLGRPLFEHGIAFSDSDSGATLHADCGPVGLDGGSWLAGRTPMNTPRADLPMWDGEGVSKALRALVDRWIAAGDLREPEPYRAPPAKPDFEYGALDISVDPEFWDAADARRNIPGVADEVRRLRAVRGLKRWESASN